MYQEYYNNLQSHVSRMFASADESTAASEPVSTTVGLPETAATRMLETGRQRRGIFERQQAQEDAISDELAAQPAAGETDALVTRTSAFLKALQDDTNSYISSQQEDEAEFVGAFGADGAEFDAPPSKGLASRRPTSRYVGGFVELMDRYEGRGDYDTLLNSSQRNLFDGIRVTEMTLNELDTFARGQYGKYSKDWKRRTGHGDPSLPSTPMGRYQFVNATLQDQAKKMGLDPATTRFTPEVQDAMFLNYMGERLGRANTMAGKIAQVRGGWEGLAKKRNGRFEVPDSVLERLIIEFEAQRDD